MRRMMGTIALLATLMVASPGKTAGIEYPELGAVAVGRGGAAAARPDGGLSLIFNPAGMAWAQSLRLDVDGKLMWNQVAFTASDPKLAQSSDGATSKNDHVFYGTPTNGTLIYGIGRVGPFSNLAVGLGVMGPSATGKLNYPLQSSARYEKTEIDYFFAYYSVAVAARIGEAWGVGLTFQLAQGSAKFIQAVRGLPGENTDLDISSTVDVSSGVLPTGVVGVTYMPHPKVSIGASYRPKISFSGDGTLTSQFPLSLQKEASQDGDSASLHLAFPHVVRLGAQYTPTSQWLLELNVVGEFWSVFNEALVVPHDITVSALGQSATLGNIHFTKQYHDALSVRVGADYEVLPQHLAVRLGYFYETSAIPTRTVSVDFPNWGRHGISAGLTGTFFGAQLHVAYAHHFVISQTVTDSQIDAVYVPPVLTDATPKEVVGNGSYTSSSDMLVIGLSVDLSKLSRNL